MQLLYLYIQKYIIINSIIIFIIIVNIIIKNNNIEYKIYTYDKVHSR